MASELRVNKLTNRSGLGTVTYTDTGAIVSGIVTANSFSGDIIGDITGAVTGTTGSFSGDVSISEKIIHTGDTNTFMKFDTDTVTFETAGDERLRITSDGKVGINDNNPSNQLIVKHPGGSGHCVAKVVSGDGTTQMTMQTVQGSEGRLGMTSNHPLAIYAGTTEKLRITSAGNIGINQTSPTCQLQIDSGSSGAGTVTHLELNHKGNDTNDAVKLNFARAGSDIGSIVLEKVSSNNTTDFIFNTRSFNTVSESMRITGAGKVGVGTDAVTFPGASDNGVHIHSTSNQARIKLTSAAVSSPNTAAVGFQIYTSSSDALIDNKENGNLRFYTNGLERVRITSDGKFSLGDSVTASPSAVFHIDYDSNNLLMLDNNSASTQKMFFASQGATHAQIYGTTSSGALTIESDPSNNHSSSLINFKVDNVEQMVINNSGVGIGTASSSGGLHIYRPDAQVRLYDTTTSGSQTAFRVMAYNGLTYIQSGTAFSSDSKAPIVFSSMFAGTEWARIDTSGRLLMNGATANGDNLIQIEGNSDDKVQIRIKRTNAIGANAVYGGLDIVDNNNADVASIRAHNEAGATASYLSFKNYTSGGSLSEKLRITSKGLLELVSGEGLKLNPYVSGQYALNGTLSYYATNNAVYLNGAGPDGWLRLNAAGTENNRNCINIYGSNHSSGDQLAFRVAANTRLAMRNSEHCVHVQGDTAATGTNHGSKGFSLQTGGGTSCPLYFGSETSVAQKSMYLNGYWIYLRGHVNEGMRFIFSQGSGAPHGSQFQFKYNQCLNSNNSTTWNTSSDERAKENIQTITNGIEIIKKLRPVTFDWTDDYADSTGMWKMDKSDPKEYNWVSKKENGYDTDRKTGQYGFIAQEYETVLPKDVLKDKYKIGDTEFNDFRTMTNDSLLPSLTAALKEAIAEIETLKTKVAALESS